MYEFLFWLFLAGLIIASITDLKRREVDNWLTLFLMISSWGFVLFMTIFVEDIFVFAVLSFIVLFFVMNIFYYGRVFGGGDAQLLFAMFAVFISATAFGTLWNIGAFVLLVLVTGSLWGIFYAGVLFFRNYSNAKKEFKKQFTKEFRFMVLSGVILFVLSYVNILFLIPAILFLSFPVLIVFARSVEVVCMIKELKGGELREGDWLVNDVKIRGRIVKSNWEGLSKEEVRLLRKKRSVKVKDGVPFVPGFLIAFLIYYFFREGIFSLL